MTEAKSSDMLLTRAGMGIEPGLPLEASTGGIEELRADIQRLMDMEAIKQLKYAYFRCLDTANFEEQAELFHDDVTVDFIGGNYAWKLQGKQAYIEAQKKAFNRKSVGQHNGHHPEIQMHSATEATAIWYLSDSMWVTNYNFFTTGSALYWDRYLKVDGRWKIRETSYRRVYELSRLLKENPAFSVHYLAQHGSEMPPEAG
jgi:hypothetical protein